MSSTTRFGALAGGLAAAVALALAPAAQANHPVFVEGNCVNPPGNPFFAASPAPGTCGDFDGDARIGDAEDTDGDRVFGTITAANGTSGANNNGTITVVTSGVFPETVTLAGNVTLEAAPGVSANLDAVRQGDPGSGPRQSQPGIIIDAPDNRFVTVRNIKSKNWTSGFIVRGSSRAALEGVIAEHNINYGIEVLDGAKVSIRNSEVLATGRRVNPAAGDFPTVNDPQPGIGIDFDDKSSGTVCSTSVVGSFRTGIQGNGRQSLALLNVFDNSPDLRGVRGVGTSCIGTRSDDGDDD